MNIANISQQSQCRCFSSQLKLNKDTVQQACLQPSSTYRQTAQKSCVVRAANEFDLDKEMIAAERRWESNVKSGRVKNITCKEAGQMLEEGWTLIDVRPPNEAAKARIENSVEVPLFIEEPSNSVGNLLKKGTALGMGGWWLGGTYYIPNKQFGQEVQQKVPKDAKLIVACQKGLRSLAACEQLSKMGYKTIAWINGGLDTYKSGDIKTKDNKDLKYGGIGGMSELLGWTEVQQQYKEGFGGNPQNFLIVAGVVLAIDLLFFGYEQYSYMNTVK